MLFRSSGPAAPSFGRHWPCTALFSLYINQKQGEHSQPLYSMAVSGSVEHFPLAPRQGSRGKYPTSSPCKLAANSAGIPAELLFLSPIFWASRIERGLCKPAGRCLKAANTSKRNREAEGLPILPALRGSNALKFPHSPTLFGRSSWRQAGSCQRRGRSRRW